MDELEAVGDMVRARRWRRPFRAATARWRAMATPTRQACLNCGTPLAGDYCHACGQRGHVHRTLTAFFHDLLHGVFHFEGQVLEHAADAGVAPRRS